MKKPRKDVKVRLTRRQDTLTPADTASKPPKPPAASAAAVACDTAPCWLRARAMLAKGQGMS
jgi:hypothetical protein